MAVISNNSNVLRFALDQSNEMCLFAVKINGRSMSFVKTQTEEISLAASKNDALRHVINQTDEMCLFCVKIANLDLASN